jgi:adenylate cyclase
MKLAVGVPAHMAMAELFRLKGELLLLDYIRRDQLLLDEAIECFRTAVTIARQQKARSLELRALTSLCRIPPDSNTGDDVWHELEECLGTFTEGESTGDLKLARSLLKQYSDEK